MRQILLVLFIGLLSAPLFCQDKTYSVGRRSFENGQGSIMIVPYENKMFLSDINREVAKRTGLEIDEIRRLFREGLCQVASNEAGMNYSVLDLLNSGIDGALDDIEYTHRSVGYEYSKVPPPEEKDKTKLKKWLDKTIDPEQPDQKDRGVTVEGGELQRWYDEKERYMDTRIANPDLVTYLNDRHQFDYILFLNELDIQVKRIPEMELGQTWDRVVKVHYTVFDKDMNRLTGGAVYNRYSGDKKDIYSIIGTNFRPIAAQIMAQIHALEESDEPEKTSKSLSLFKRDKRDNASNDDDDF
jgi:hypothetical protein